MENRYKLKEEHRDLVDSDDLMSKTYQIELGNNPQKGWFYYENEDNNRSWVVFRDEMFDKVEEERSLKIISLYVTHKQPSQHIFNYELSFTSNKEIGVKLNGNNIELSDEEGKPSFAANGELVEKEFQVLGELRETTPIRENGTTYYTKRENDMDLIDVYKRYKKQGGKEDIKQFIKFCYIQNELDHIKGCQEYIEMIEKDKFFK